jgi:gamma-butyrobetaine dioxygenase
MAMHITSALLRGPMLSTHWADGSTADYPLIYLRDNDPAGFHPQTHERVLDLLALPEDPQAEDASLDDGLLTIRWADGAAPTILSQAWLSAHRPGRRADDPASVAPVTWDGTFLDRIPRHAASAVSNEPEALAAWMRDTKRYGFTVITGLDDDENAGVRLGEHIGFLRQTNFGTTFRVETMPDPNNLAYTSGHLPLHTDLPNQELPPGYQFLHCVRNGATGGASIFADSYHIAETLRQDRPEAFRLLTEVTVPYRFHDRAHDIRVHRPVISLDELGRVFDVRYSAHLMDAFDMEAGLMTEYYSAFRAFMALTRDPTLIVTFKMKPGEMVAFDNRRTLHGRTAFDPSSGHRLLKGFYIDRGEFDSRLRKLAST